MKRAAVIVLVVLLTSDLLDEASTEPQLRFLFPHPWEVVRELGQVVLSLSLTFPHSLSPSSLSLSISNQHTTLSLSVSQRGCTSKWMRAISLANGWAMDAAFRFWPTVHAHFRTTIHASMLGTPYST